MNPRGSASIALLLLLLPPAASGTGAEDLRNVLNGYSLTSWGTNDGLPSSEVLAIAQDVSGFLWLGTDGGLVRFDGSRFVLQNGPALGRSVRALHVLRNGELWAGLGEQGGVLRYRRTAPGVMTPVDQFSTAHGLGAGAVRAIVEDTEGTVWAGHLGGLFRFADGRWTRWEAAGLDQAEVHALAVDRKGRLVVGTRRGVLVSSADDRRLFEPLDAGPIRDEPVPGISIDATGAIWRADGVHGFQGRVGQRLPIVPNEIARGNRLMHDRSGHLWVGTGGQGLWRVSELTEGRVVVERTTVLTGLLGNGVVSLLEDREGNIWAGTLDGLNRLTRYVATPIQTLGLVSGIEISPQGIWVVTADSLLLFPDEGTLDAPLVKHRGEVKAIHADEHGRLWMSTGNRLSWFDNIGHHDMTPCSGALRSIGLAASDRRGGLWLYDTERGLHQCLGREVRPAPVPSGVQRARLTWMDTTKDGTLWLAMDDGRLARVDKDGRTREYPPSEAFDLGPVRTWHLDTQGALWLGGVNGIGRIKDDVFTMARETHGHQLEGLTSIIEDGYRRLWVAARSGLLRVSAADFERHLSASADPVPLAYINKGDGLAGNPRWYGHRAAIRDRRGRLWFVTSRGLSVVDPDRIAAAKPVDASIHHVVVDGHVFDAAQATTLPPGTRRLDVQFAALALTSPAIVRFRYRLEGFDAGWVDAGVQRAASYTNLPPGSYRLRVMATRTDGTWPDRAAEWSFTVKPMFYQTAQFFLVCVVGILCLGIVAWRLHLRRVRGEMSILLAERARMAREIHDTLLQGLFGIALRCDAIAAEVKATAPHVSEYFIDMRRGVEQYVREARQSILGLRSPALEQLGLAAALRTMGEHLTAGTDVRFLFESKGASHAHPSALEEHVLRIGQEAITNAVRHARATVVRAELRYTSDGIMLQVSDDGRGVDPSLAEHAGGLGLASMRERARAAGGIVNVESVPGRGTRVEVRVPHGRSDAVA